MLVFRGQYNSVVFHPPKKTLNNQVLFFFTAQLFWTSEGVVEPNLYQKKRKYRETGPFLIILGPSPLEMVDFLGRESH